MRVVVAGGNGFLGSEIVRALQEHGHEVGVLGRSRPRAGEVTWIEADVTRPETIGEKLAGWDAVVDAVQFPNSPMENPRKGYTFENIDLGGTRNLVDAAEQAGVGHYIDISGVGAAPDARFHWFRFKWEAEQHVIASGVAYTIFRPSWVFGPGDVSLNRFLGFARFLPFVPVIGNGRTRINPVLVGDVAAHVAAAVAAGPQHAIFEIGGPATMTMDDIVRTALRAQRKKRFLLHQPVWLMKFVARAVQYVPGRPITPDGIDFVTQDGVADTRSLEETFRLPLTPFDDAVRSYLTR